MVKKKRKYAIDQVLNTLYARFIGKHSIDAKIERAGMEKIEKLLKKIEDETVVKNTKNRLHRYDEFKAVTDEEQDRIFRFARDHGITIEEAYERLGKTSS